MPKNLGLYNDDLSTPRKKDVDNCYGPNNAPPYPVTSVNGQTGAVTLTKANVGLNNVDNVKQYSAKNPPPYPVTSVNKKTGAVALDASDVNAVAKTGDSMTGTLTVGSASLETNGYVTGTWFKTTANTALSTKPSKIAVIDNGWIYSRTPEQIKNDIGLNNVDNIKQYSASNPPPYPVTSVNGQTGDVIVSANQFKPAGKSYLTFSSPKSFTLKVNDTTKHWDGTLEYFVADKTWATWDGTTTLSSVDNDGEQVLYLRGTGNTVINGMDPNYIWVLTGADISCIGNIENLLDYATVESGEHPTMAPYCYFGMFYGCTALTQAPALSATTLTDSCYAGMFYGCTSLTQAPALPATTLATDCYYYMFYGCTSLTQAPALPATTLASSCYESMFYGCTALTQAPALSATTLANSCYNSMFYGCTSLTQAPALPATRLVNRCYSSMFYGCTSLKISTTQTGEYTQEYRIPSSGNGTTATNALTNMFASTGGTFTGTPSINTTYYLSSDNMVVRETEIATLKGYIESMIDAAIANAIGG